MAVVSKQKSNLLEQFNEKINSVDIGNFENPQITIKSN